MAIKELSSLRNLVQSKSSDPILSAIEWLALYIEQSWQIKPEYLTIPAVTKILEPLKAVVPYTSINKQLYRIIGRKSPLAKGESVDLSAKVLTSFTFTGRSDWEALADQIGARDAVYCYVLKLNSSIIEVASAAWALGPVLKYAKRVYPNAKETQLLNNQSGFVWQKEVMGYSSSLQATVIANISY